jgi:hypothetical protein
VGFRGRDILIEIKSPEGSLNKQRPRQNQVDWHRSWRGRPVAVVLCFDDMVRLFEP